MSSSTAQRQRLVTIALVLGVILLVIILRLAGPGETPKPPATASALERYFAFKVVAPNLDPIVMERERKLFDSAVNLLRQDPDFFDGWMTIGGVKKAMGDFTGAADIWTHAGTIRPFNSISYNNLADLYANFLEDYPKAVVAYRRAIRNSAGEEKNALFYSALYDVVRFKLKDNEQALTVLEEGVEANPQSVLLQGKLAAFYATLGQRAKALAAYQAALKLDPQNQDLVEEYRRYRDQR